MPDTPEREHDDASTDGETTTSRFAIASLVCGIGALPLVPYVFSAIVLGVLGLVLGKIAEITMEENAAIGGARIAIVGKLLGGIASILALMWLAIQFYWIRISDS